VEPDVVRDEDLAVPGHDGVHVHPVGPDGEAGVVARDRVLGDEQEEG
jgi:hypothetical protein